MNDFHLFPQSPREIHLFHKNLQDLERFQLVLVAQAHGPRGRDMTDLN